MDFRKARTWFIESMLRFECTLSSLCSEAIKDAASVGLLILFDSQDTFGFEYEILGLSVLLAEDDLAL
jgi:hypothetical protein